MAFKFGIASLKNREGVHCKLIEISNMALALSNVDFGIPSTGGVRTQQEQHRLFIDGKSKCDGVFHVSKHQLGRAIDFYAYVDGKASWEKEHLAQVACAFLQAALYLGHRIKWGGFFNDMPHIELIDDKV